MNRHLDTKSTFSFACKIAPESFSQPDDAQNCAAINFKLIKLEKKFIKTQILRIPLSLCVCPVSKNSQISHGDALNDRRKMLSRFLLILSTRKSQMKKLMIKMANNKFSKPSMKLHNKKPEVNEKLCVWISSPDSELFIVYVHFGGRRVREGERGSNGISIIVMRNCSEVLFFTRATFYAIFMKNNGSRRGFMAGEMENFLYLSFSLLFRGRVGIKTFP